LIHCRTTVVQFLQHLSTVIDIVWCGWVWRPTLEEICVKKSIHCRWWDYRTSFILKILPYIYVKFWTVPVPCLASWILHVICIYSPRRRSIWLLTIVSIWYWTIYPMASVVVAQMAESLTRWPPEISHGRFWITICAGTKQAAKRSYLNWVRCVQLI